MSQNNHQLIIESNESNNVFTLFETHLKTNHELKHSNLITF